MVKKREREGREKGILWKAKKWLTVKLFSLSLSLVEF